MTDTSMHDRLSSEEASGWDAVIEQIDRIAPDRFEAPGAGPDDWSAKDVLFHLGAWWEEAAARLTAIREDRYTDERIETDERNARYLREGRTLGAGAVRTRAERARARALAEWSAVHEPTAPAVEWFGETGAEHYAEHLGELRAFADAEARGGRPGAAERHAGLVRAEADAWSGISSVIDAMSPSAIERPGVTPDGWTVKDTMWHVAKWWEDFLDVVPKFDDPAFDPDDGSAEEIDALNRTWFEESSGLPIDVVRSRWTDARSAGVECFRAMLDPSRTAERWFEECGTIHYEKHLIDLRPWAAQVGTLLG